MIRHGMTKLEKWMLIVFGPYLYIKEHYNDGYCGCISWMKKNGEFGTMEWDRWGKGRPM